jgi:hypothetical protein
VIALVGLVGVLYVFEAADEVENWGQIAQELEFVHQFVAMGLQMAGIEAL